MSLKVLEKQKQKKSFLQGDSGIKLEYTPFWFRFQGKEKLKQIIKVRYAGIFWQEIHTPVTACLIHGFL